MMKKRAWLSAGLSAAIGAAMLLTPLSAAAEGSGYLDNSDLMPKYVDDAQVTLEDSGGGLQSPDWVKSMIIAEVVIARATEEGTFQAAVKVLDHYREMGVNTIWLTPFMDTSQNTGGHYGNFGPHTVDPSLTGCDNYADSWQVVKAFVDEAHKRNIRVISDMVTWGVEWNAPLYTEHPEWFAGTSAWGGYSFNWNNADLVAWFKAELLKYVTDIGFDGFRCDCEPGTTGYSLYREIREAALAQGQKIAVFSENTNERLEPAYDFDEHSSAAHTWDMYDMYIEWLDIVESTKKGYGLGTENLEIWDEAGTARFYAFNMSCHDNKYAVNGSMVNFAYQALLSPFIPIFFMGDEFMNPQRGNSTTFLTPLQLSLLDDPDGQERAFYERVKQIIRIRLQYPEIFTYFPENHRDSNICAVEAVGLETLNGYARYGDGKALLVIPNNNVHDTESAFTVRIPYTEMGMENNTEYTVKNAVTGEVVAKGDRVTLYDFKAKVGPTDVAVYLVEPTGETLPAQVLGASDEKTDGSASGSTGADASAADGSADSTGTVTDGSSAAADTGTAGKADAADAAQDRPATGVGTAWAVAAALCAAAGGTLAFVLRRKKLRA